MVFGICAKLESDKYFPAFFDASFVSRQVLLLREQPVEPIYLLRVLVVKTSEPLLIYSKRMHDPREIVRRREDHGSRLATSLVTST